MATEVAGLVEVLTADGATVVLSIDGAAAAAPGYELVDAQETESTRRRDVATSPYVPGEAEISSVPAALSYVLSIRCKGTSGGSRQSVVDALVAAVTARAWRLRVTLAGAVETYDCRAAERISKPRTPEDLVRHVQIVDLTIPARRI